MVGTGATIIPPGLCAQRALLPPTTAAAATDKWGAAAQPIPRHVRAHFRLSGPLPLSNLRENRQQSLASCGHPQAAIQPVPPVPTDLHSQGQLEGACAPEARRQFDGLSSKFVEKLRDTELKHNFYIVFFYAPNARSVPIITNDRIKCLYIFMTRF